jgi:nucleoside-diphosphate-sugar epimerase
MSSIEIACTCAIEIDFIIFVNMILVTGGTGLVGAHLLLHLIESQSMGNKSARYLSIYTFVEKTALFTLYKRKLFWNKSEWICADITDVPSLEIAFQNINGLPLRRFDFF